MKIQVKDQCEGQATIQFSLEHDNLDSRSIAGRLRGPFCHHSRTLPSNFIVKHGKTVVVDPCFWTPKMPFLYELQLTFESPTETQQVEFTFGLRWCTLHGSGLRLNGKPYVVRAITADSATDIDALVASSASLVMPQFSAPICESASRLGVLIVCLDTLTPEQAELAQRYPSLHFARGGSSLPTGAIALADQDVARDAVQLMPETDLSKVRDSQAKSARFIVRNGAAGSLADLRQECDRLQRDVARYGQFAGYLIDSGS